MWTQLPRPLLLLLPTSLTHFTECAAGLLLPSSASSYACQAFFVIRGGRGG